MNLLLEAAGPPDRFSEAARNLLNNPRNELPFSAASLWEIDTKSSLGRSDFNIDPRLLCRGLLENGSVELPVTSEHAFGVGALPSVHSDPFDRLLLAQALSKGGTLVTGDAVLARYPGHLRKV